MRSYITVILMLAATGCSQPKVASTAPIHTTTTVQSTQSTSNLGTTADSGLEAPQNNDAKVESTKVKPTSSVVSSQNQQKSNSLLSQQATLTSNKPASRINIRDAASTKANARHYGFAGDSVKILDEKQDDKGKIWYQVKFVNSEASGWVSGNFVKLNKNDIFNSAPIIDSTSDGNTDNKPIR
jgi:Bacterial SH3 domain